MKLKKGYFTTILAALIAIAFSIGFFYFQDYYMKKYQNRQDSVTIQIDIGKYINEVNSYYQKKIETYNSKLEATLPEPTIIKDKIGINKSDIFKEQYEKLDTLHKKSVHKFVINMLRYNPYLPQSQIKDEIKNYFDSSVVPLRIIVNEQSSFIGDQIIIEEQTSKSNLFDGRELTLVFKEQKNIPHESTTEMKIKNEVEPQSNTLVEKLHIKPFDSDRKNLQVEKKLDKKTVTPLLTNDTLLFLIVAIVLLLGIRLIVISRYNYKIQTLFINKIKNSEPIDKSAFSQNTDLLELVENYNRLITLRGDIMEQSSSMEKKHEQFIADSIHQIKTPLSAIMINMDLIEMSIDTKDIDKFISQIKTSIDMLTLTYEELSYLSMNSTLEYKPTYLNLSQTVQARLDFFKEVSINNDKKIVSTVLSNLYSTINKIEFERIVDNNLINAIKYSKNNSVIEVSFIKLGNRAYQLSITSQGNEINNTEDIFKRHYREEEGKRGHGLGLAITKEICDKYGIDIEYKRENGKNIFQYTIHVT